MTANQEVAVTAQPKRWDLADGSPPHQKVAGSQSSSEQIARELAGESANAGAAMLQLVRLSSPTATLREKKAMEKPC